MTTVSKSGVIKMIDAHKNKLSDPIDRLAWTWVRVIIDNIPDDQWELAVEKATEALSQ
jgi:hypothetical protein